jgi:hypothetical protein
LGTLLVELEAWDLLETYVSEGFDTTSLAVFATRKGAHAAFPILLLPPKRAQLLENATTFLDLTTGVEEYLEDDFELVVKAFGDTHTIKVNRRVLELRSNVLQKEHTDNSVVVDVSDTVDGERILFWVVRMLYKSAFVECPVKENNHDAATVLVRGIRMASQLGMRCVVDHLAAKLGEEISTVVDLPSLWALANDVPSPLLAEACVEFLHKNGGAFRLQELECAWPKGEDTSFRAFVRAYAKRCS